MRRPGRRPDTHDQVYSVTSAPESLRDDQSERMRRYLISMSIRTVCFILAVFTAGVLRWSLVTAAVVLPYVAVVMANAVRARPSGFVGDVPPPVPHREALPPGTSRYDD